MRMFRIKTSYVTYKQSFAFLSLLLLFNCGFAQEDKKEAEEINWISLEEAILRNESEPKKFIIDVWTTWCGWCKKMDASTFKNPIIVDYINTHFYAISLNAERKDTVFLGAQTFINEFPNKKRHPHQLAISLLQGKITYPTIVYLDEDVNMLQPIAGFQDAKSIEPIIHYFAENAYKKMSWGEFQTQFKGQVGK